MTFESGYFLNKKTQTFVKQSENAWLNYKTFIETRMD